MNTCFFARCSSRILEAFTQPLTPVWEIAKFFSFSTYSLYEFQYLVVARRHSRLNFASSTHTKVCADQRQLFHFGYLSLHHHEHLVFTSILSLSEDSSKSNSTQSSTTSRTMAPCFAYTDLRPLRIMPSHMLEEYDDDESVHAPSVSSITSEGVDEAAGLMKQESMSEMAERSRAGSSFSKWQDLNEDLFDIMFKFMLVSEEPITNPWTQRVRTFRTASKIAKDGQPMLGTSHDSGFFFAVWKRFQRSLSSEEFSPCCVRTLDSWSSSKYFTRIPLSHDHQSAY